MSDHNRPANSSDAPETEVRPQAEAPGDVAKPTVITPTPPPAADPLINQQIGNFKIISLMGKGAFGSVYKAQDRSLGRDVAIKFLHDPLDPPRRLLFEREGRALAALGKEASIVEIYQWGEHGNQNYVVLEFVADSVEKRLEEHPDGLPVAMALRLVAECAEAIQAAHDHDILHRDIKPANILIEPKGDRAKVADFGLARIQDNSEFTLMQTLSGSPPYMSPEQASLAEIDGRSDVFSLGVTLYEMLSGGRPFVGETSSQIMEQIRNDDRVPLIKRRGGLADRIYEIVNKATAHAVADRYQTARDFARDLRIALNDIERLGRVAPAEPLAANMSRGTTGVTGFKAATVVLLVLPVVAIGLVLVVGLGLMMMSNDDAADGPSSVATTAPREPVPGLDREATTSTVAAEQESADADGAQSTFGAPPSQQAPSAPVAAASVAPPPPAAASESARGIVEFFCEQWARENYKAMYQALSTGRQAQVSESNWAGDMLQSDHRTGAVKSSVVTGPTDDYGSRSSWNVVVTFRNGDTAAKTYEVIQEDEGWRIGPGAMSTITPKKFGPG
jgi:hypothetical protein